MMAESKLTKEKIAEITADLQEKFLLFDKDGDHVISKNELGAVMRSFGDNPTEEDLNALMKELDADGSDHLEFNEFLKLMEKSDRLSVMMKRKLTETQIKEIRTKFDQFDDDHDGAIDKKELRNVIRSLGHNPTDEELQVLLDELDTDGTSMLEFPEFLVLMQQNAKYINTMLNKRLTDQQRARLMKNFKVFDDDDSGSIDKKELKNVLKSFGQNPTDKEIDDLLKGLDSDGSNMLEFDEFVELMKKSGKLKSMVRKKLTTEQVNILKSEFMKFDDDGDCAIDKQELAKIMESLGQPCTDDELQKLLNELDLDGTNLLEFSEFVDLLQDSGKIDYVVRKQKDPLKFKVNAELTNEQTDEIREKFMVFAVCDDNNDGTINSNELEAVMKYMGQNPTKKELQEIMTKMDTNNSGTLEFREFLELMKSIKNEEPLPFDPTLNTDNLTPDEKEVIKEKFLLFDEDGSGSISKEELGAAMRYMGLNPTEAEVQTMLDSLDEDGTCQLEFPEFLKLMSQIKNHDPLSFDLTGQLTTKQIAEIQEKFLQFDDDQDGVIDKSELGAILRYMGQTPTDLELEDILSKLDEDGTNVLEFPEFLKLMTSLQLKPVKAKFSKNEIKEMKSKFEMFDTDGSGTICIKELGRLLRYLGYNPSEADIKDIMSSIDKDDTGQIEFLEFVDLMTTKLVKKKKTNDAELERAFHVLDKSKKGFILCAKMNEIVTTLGEKLSVDEANQLIKDLDINKDGKITNEEFMNTMAQGQTQR